MQTAQKAAGLLRISSIFERIKPGESLSSSE
jgi:hypothetical protein